MAAFASSYNRETVPGARGSRPSSRRWPRRCSARRAPRCWRCSAASGSCCWWHARTWRRCRSSRVDERSPRWRCGSRSVRAPRGSAAALLAESLVLAVAGGGLGVAIASSPAYRCSSRCRPARCRGSATPRLDATTLAFAPGITLAAAAATALAPIAARHRRCARRSAGGARTLAAGGSRLRAVARRGRGRARARPARRRRAAGAQLRGAPRRRRSASSRERVLAIDAGASETRLSGARAAAPLLREARLPGADAARRRVRRGVTLRPLWGTVGMDWRFTVEGQSEKDAERNPLLNFETVSAATTSGRWASRSREGARSTTRDRDGQPGRDRERRAGAALLARAGPDRQAAQDPAAADRVPQRLADRGRGRRRRALPGAHGHAPRPLHAAPAVGPPSAPRRRPHARRDDGPLRGDPRHAARDSIPSSRRRESWR